MIKSLRYTVPVKRLETSVPGGYLKSVAFASAKAKKDTHSKPKANIAANFFFMLIMFPFLIPQYAAAKIARMSSRVSLR